MAAPKADPLPETVQQTVAKPPPPAKKAKVGAEAAPQAPPPQKAPASPPPTKPTAQAPKEVPGGKAPKPKARPPQPKEQRAPEAVGAAEADIFVPVPEEGQPPSRPFAPDTFQSHTPEEDARVLNYRRLSHFRHRRYYSRGKSGIDPRLAGSSLWDPEGNVSTKPKQQTEAEATAGTQPAEYIVENYVRPPSGPVEAEMSPMKMICIGVGLVVVVLIIAAWISMAMRRARGHTTLSEGYDNEFGAMSNAGPFDVHRGFAGMGSNAVLSAKVTVRDVSVNVEEGDVETSEAI
ncbi:hypothetical protein V5799_010912 [Amblyomma americanum]|uniref:Uncharacterized protein n=1 Tax=Amblyomma americanum TaxID=6943 RepID=A0AAQ4EIW1_AMBAM